MKKLVPVALCGAAVAGPTSAAELQLKIEIPRLTVAEYHNPYVAVWLENAQRTSTVPLAVWYDVRKANNEGTEWLKDLRQWWRRLGRELRMPIDGVTGATRSPGEHTLIFDDNKPSLAQLPPGEYRLIVEAAREVGGRELLDIPLTWPVKQPAEASASGKSEIGKLTLTLKP